MSAAPHASALTEVPEILARANSVAKATGEPFAGTVNPLDAYELFRNGDVVLVDVRTAEERKFVGHVPGSLHVPWATGTSLTRNPRFARELEAKVGKDAFVLLICRSGKRSAEGAAVATKAGFHHVYNVAEGFEGEIDEKRRRGGLGGWRFRGLPWEQD
jgi:rhodanese-related sulfurtransferase